MQGRDVLIWIVENPTEFVPFLDGAQIKFQDGDFSHDELIYRSYAATYNPTDSYHGYNEVVMAPAVMKYRTQKEILFEQLYEYFQE